MSEIHIYDSKWVNILEPYFSKVKDDIGVRNLEVPCLEDWNRSRNRKGEEGKVRAIKTGCWLGPGWCYCSFVLGYLLQMDVMMPKPLYNSAIVYWWAPDIFISFSTPSPNNNNSFRDRGWRQEQHAPAHLPLSPSLSFILINYSEDQPTAPILMARQPRPLAYSIHTCL